MSKSSSNFLQALAAVVGGNALYFMLEKYLPAPAHHALFKADFGMVVDFCICLVFFLIIKALAARRDETKLDEK